MSNEDHKAMQELASEMTWFEAINFIREQTYNSAKEAGQDARFVVAIFPESNLAKSYYALPKDSASRKLFK